MKTIFVIFKKEFLDTLRDRRTIILMIVLPVLIFPLIMNLMTMLTASHKKQASEKTLQVGLVLHDNAQAFRSRLMERKDMNISGDVEESAIQQLIQDKKYDFVLVFEKEFDQKVAAHETGAVEMYFKASSENEIAKKRLHDMFNTYKKELLNARLKEKELGGAFVVPLNINERDLATTKEKLGEYVGGFLPYIFILFCFLGAMYPAIDLAAGEKERATLETLLTSPASRMQIVTGKFLVITTAGIVSALLSMLGLFMSVKMNPEIPQEILSTILKIVEFKSIAMMLSLLVPLTVFLAAVLLCFSIFAKSFKEAQSIMTPMNFMVIVPVAVGMLPGVKLSLATAWIPILNVSLATKEIISGTIQPLHLAVVYISLFVMAAAALIFCAQWFKRESVIFRGI